MSLNMEMVNGRRVVRLTNVLGYDFDVPGRMYVGDWESGDYFQVDSDGTIHAMGAASCWDDILGDVMSKKLYATTGKVDYDWDENAIKFQPGGDKTDKNDRVQFNCQYPHRAVADGEMRFHLHYFQPDAVKRVFNLQYRVQSNGSAKNSTWSEIEATCVDDDAFSYPGSGDFNNILKFSAIDMTNAGISATVQCKLTRVDNLADNVLVTFADFHYEIDMMGSKQEYVK